MTSPSARPLALSGVRRLLNPSIVFFLGLFLLYTAVSQEGRAGYEFENYMTAESIVERGSIQFIWSTAAVPKLIYPRHGVLQPLLEAPLYWAAREIGFVRSSLLDTRTRLRSRGFAVSLFLPLIAALTALLILDLARRLFAPRTAWLIALLAATATMLFPYAALGMELFLTATLTASVYFLYRLKESGRFVFAMLAGMAMGALLNSKTYASAFLVVLGVYALYVVALQRQRTARQKFGLLATIALAFLPFFALYAWFGIERSGNWLSLPSAAVFLNMATPLQDWHGYLFAPGKSIFLYNPPLLLLPIALAPMFRRHKAETLLIMGLVATLLFLFAGTWAAFPDEVWGPRFWTPLAPLLTLCCGAAIDRLLTSRRGKALLFAIFAAGLYVQILGVTFQYAIPINIAQAGGAATTPEMYFVPQYSSLYINSLNLVSGLRRTFGLSSLTYRTTLLRAVPGTGDTPVHGPEVKLGGGYDRLDLILFHWPGRLQRWPLSSDRFLALLYGLLFCAPLAAFLAVLRQRDQANAAGPAGNPAFSTGADR